jgi:hypothetical protein
VGPHDAADQGQPESQASEASGGRGVDLGEVVEDALEPIGRDAHALVGDREPQAGGAASVASSSEAATRMVPPVGEYFTALSSSSSRLWSR